MYKDCYRPHSMMAHLFGHCSYKTSIDHNGNETVIDLESCYNFSEAYFRPFCSFGFINIAQYVCGLFYK